VSRPRKLFNVCVEYIRGGRRRQGKGINTSKPQLYNPTSSHFNSYHPNHLATYARKAQATKPSTMNNLDSHPRVLSVSSTSRTSSSNSTPQASTTATPATQSRRASHESAHDAHHFIATQDKTSNTLNGSIKKIWKEIKHHAAEHHRSVNMAYQAQYGGGARMDLGRPSGL
jgi:hypothetical protein